ncbi:hypothetical protein GA0074695_0374 [Micromonospora viridifaciens]|uniref:Small integral membrane protein n=1 Tax=Micromonospora viridifaciens TaxID=1881 RepID=A0A1C4UCX2_MICVI|nr:DUF2273 domain-containing protein [Micromonospora viridifaciens]SCE69502.1 hypothetical protein GA0074695_0374 [Micromonospora viridifaciens]
MIKLIGVVVGLALGFALAFGSFGQMLIVALFAVIGYAVSKFFAGEVNLAPYVQGRRSSQ